MEISRKIHGSWGQLPPGVWCPDLSACVFHFHTWRGAWFPQVLGRKRGLSPPPARHRWKPLSSQGKPCAETTAPLFRGAPQSPVLCDPGGEGVFVTIHDKWLFLCMAAQLWGADRPVAYHAGCTT